jgi:hypothetical protein
MRRALRRSIAILALLLLFAPEPVSFQAFAQTRIELAAKSRRARKAKLPRTKAKSEAKTKKAKGPAPKEARAWTTAREGRNPVLQYGKGADETIVSFACQPAEGLVRVVAIAGPRGRGLRPGDGARIRLMSGPHRFEVAGVAFASGRGSNLFVSGTTRIAPRFFSLFKGSETMNVEVPGRTTGISLKGLGKRIEAFERDCLGDK